MKNKIQFLINNFVVIVAILSIAGLVVYAQTSWLPPTSAPPGDNTPAPVNVSASNQVKIGGLGVGPLAVFGNAAVTGNIDVSGIYKKGGKDGVSLVCPAGSAPVPSEVSGGIVTGATCGPPGGGGGGGAVACNWSGWSPVSGNCHASKGSCSGNYYSVSGFCQNGVITSMQLILGPLY